MSQLIMQILATLVAFGIGYGGIMASTNPTGRFMWAALVAGLANTGLYHAALWQGPPTGPNTSVSTSTEKVQITQTPAAPGAPAPAIPVKPIAAEPPRP